MVEKEPLKNRLKRSGKIALYGLGGILSGGLVVSGPIAGISKGFTGSYIPPGWQSVYTDYPSNPCTNLAPFSDRITQQRTAGFACSNDEDRTIVVVDFANLSRKDEQTIATDTRRVLDKNSQGFLNPHIVFMPASADAQARLNNSRPLLDFGCMSLSDPRISPSEIAYTQMSEIRDKYPNSYIVSLSPQIVCESNGNEYGGVAYDGYPFATVFPNVIDGTGNASDMKIAVDCAHEIGHLDNLGHAGYITFSSETDGINRGSLNRWKSIELQNSKYEEYGDYTNMMGNIQNLTGIETPALNEVDLDVLNWPQKVIGEDYIEGKKTVGDKWLSLNQKEIDKGGYIMIPLDQPVSLVGTNGVTTFDTFVITPSFFQGRGSNPDGYDLQYMLYDAKSTHNTAYSETYEPVFVNSKFRLTVDNQVIQIQTTKNGLLLRTHVPSGSQLKQEVRPVVIGR